MRQLCSLLIVGLVMTGAAEGQERLRVPRVAPLPGEPHAWSPELRVGVEAFGGDPVTNLVRTVARHPSALAGIAPLAGYVRDQAVATAVDQVLVALRVAWLCRSDAVWAERAAEARTLGLGADDLRRVAEGPGAGWGTWDATVLQAADELYREAFLSDATWDALARRYNDRQLLDLIFTGAEYIMLSMLANTLGVQPDEVFSDRLPADVPRGMTPAAFPPGRLTTARLKPVPRDEWTDEQQELLDPDGSGRPSLNLFMTLVRHPRLYRARGAQSRYIRTGSTLSGRVRELLILRMGWLCGAEYEWAQHAPIGREEGLADAEIVNIAVGPAAPGWDPFEATLLRAVDELHRHDMVSDETWATLAAVYDERQLIDVVITAAGYRMVSMVLNALGVQTEPGKEGFPAVTR